MCLDLYYSCPGWRENETAIISTPSLRAHMRLQMASLLTPLNLQVWNILTLELECLAKQA